LKPSVLMNILFQHKVYLIGIFNKNHFFILF